MKDSAAERPHTSEDEVGTHEDSEETVEGSEVDEEEVPNYFLQKGHEGCEEYTGLTTFHGMIRVFNSKTWTSLIFWCFVVMTCLVFYMSFCGYIISSFAYGVTFQRSNSSLISPAMISYFICSVDKIFCSNVSVMPKMSECVVIPRRNLTCAKFSVPMHEFTLTSDLKGLRMFVLVGDDDVWLADSNPLHTHVRLETTQVQRLNLTRSRCIRSWEELSWLPSPPNVSYSLKACESGRAAKLNLVDNECSNSPFSDDFCVPKVVPSTVQRDYPCYPPCTELSTRLWRWLSKTSAPRATHMSFSHARHLRTLVETRKMAITDVLCYLGGASSLFMGCSCVTLLEMFIFLFKLVVQSSCASQDDLIMDDALEVPVLAALEPQAATQISSPYKDAAMGAQPDCKKSASAAGGPRDLIAPSSPSVPHPTHCARLTEASDESDDPLPPVGTRRAPRLGQMRERSHFNVLDSHEIEKSARNLPLQLRLSVDYHNRNRFLSRQTAIEVDDDDLEEYLGTDSEGVGEFDRFHPARMRVRRVSSVTSRSSSSSHRIQGMNPARPPSRVIYSKMMPMNDF